MVCIFDASCIIIITIPVITMIRRKCWPTLRQRSHLIIFLQCHFMPNIHISAGLDPAFPLYMSPDASTRLNVNDADFVDVIHTDGHLYGYPWPMGHADFFPNGGGPYQPGCDVQDMARRKWLQLICEYMVPHYHPLSPPYLQKHWHWLCRLSQTQKKCFVQLPAVTSVHGSTLPSPFGSRKHSGRDAAIRLCRHPIRRQSRMTVTPNRRRTWACMPIRRCAANSICAHAMRHRLATIARERVEHERRAQGICSGESF